MLYWLFTDGAVIAGYIYIPLLIALPIVLTVVCWNLGKAGGRTAEGGTINQVPFIISYSLAALTLSATFVTFLGENFARRGRNVVDPGLGETLMTLLVAEPAYNRRMLLTGAALMLFFSILAIVGVYQLIRDGGPLREAINTIRDPSRARGQSGSANFCSMREFVRFRSPDKDGLPLVGAFWGAEQNKATGKRNYPRLDYGQGRMNLSGEDIARGILTIGGPGSGKSQSVILPAIADHMLYGHSVIVVDPQGELTPKVLRFAAVTRHQVIVHDPTSTTAARFNLAQGVSNVSDARSISGVLVPSADGDNKFWSDSAASLLSACLIRFDNLGQIYMGMSDMEMIGSRLSEKEDDASMLANSFLVSLQTDGRLASNVVATLATALTGWADEVVRESTSYSDFDAEQMVAQPTAVVLACPGRQRAIYAPYLGGVLRKLMLDLDTIGERNRGPLPLPVGVILDEFPTLGKLDSLVADVNLVRKRRISIMIAAQTKGQFHMIYQQAGTDALFAGMATQIIFGGCDQETADFYSKASGTTTELIEVEGAGFNLPKFGFPDSQVQPDQQMKQEKPQKIQRQLLTSDEIQRPARGNATIFTRYVSESYATQLILWAKLTRMYEREDWNEMLKGKKESDAMLVQRPIQFGKPAEKKQPVSN